MKSFLKWMSRQIGVIWPGILAGLACALMGCTAQSNAQPTRTLALVEGASEMAAPTFTPTTAIGAAPTVTAQPTKTATPPEIRVVLPPLERQPSPPVAEILLRLENLPISEFFDQSFQYLLLRSPETLTELGLSANFGLRDHHLDDLSDAFRRETQALEAGILQMLQTYDRESLSAQEQISYDVYRWYLENQVRGHEFMYHDYPLHHFLGSYHLDLQLLLTEKHPLETRQNAEDYLYRLAQIETQVAQLLDGLAIRTDLGVIPPTYILELTRQSLLAALQASTADPAAIQPENLAYYTRFSAGLDQIDELTADEKQAFRDLARTEIADSVIPAYLGLLGYIDQVMPRSTAEAGAWKLPNGSAYYEYILHLHTSTDLTPDEVHELGLQEVARIQAEMGAILADLGYDSDEALGTLMNWAIRAGGFYDTSTPAGQQQVIAAYEQMLAEMEARLDDYFEIGPEAGLIVRGLPQSGGGFYEASTVDGTRPGVFYAGTGGGAIPKFNMATIAYHEAIPGHHYQIALAQELDLPLFSNVIMFNGHGEGWAVYSERLAWEMGLYANDPYGNLGRLHLELLRAIRMVADTGINAKGWTREETKTYIQTALGDPAGGWDQEADRYIVRPGQASGYLVGMLEILALRQLAMEELGDQFDIREFHSAVIGHGSLPLEILAQIVADYVQLGH